MRGEFRVGDRRVRPSLGEVSGGDREVQRLNPKALAVLLALAERPGEVVAKDELLERVWPDQFIGDDVLANSIYELRKALGDDARRPSYIETVHRRGYRLIAPVRPAEPSAIALETPAEAWPLTEASVAPIESGGRSSRLRWLAATTVILAVAFGLGPGGSDDAISVVVRSVEVTGAAEASNLDARLRSALRQAMDASPVLERPRLFRHTDLWIDAAATVVGGELALTAQLDGPRHPGESPRPLRTSYPAGPTALDRFARSVRLEIELRVLGDDDLRDRVWASGARDLAAYRAYAEAEELVLRQEYEDAIGRLNAAIAHDPTFVAAYEKLARMQDNRGFTGHALEAIDRAIALVAADPAATELDRWWLELRRARIEGHATEQLRIVENEILARRPDDPTALFNRAWIYGQLLKDCETSLRLYPQVPGIETSRPLRRFWAGTLFMCSDDPSEALTRMEALARAEPSQAVLDSLAYHQILTGRLEDAEASLDRRDALETGGRAYISREPLRGLLEMARGRFEAALEAIDAYTDPSLGPNFHAAAAFRRGQALLALGRPEQALAAQRAALTAKPSSIANRWIAGLALLELGDVEGAVGERAAMRELFAGTGSHYELEFLYHLEGRIHRARGKRKEAVRSFKQALAERPHDRGYFLRELAAASK